MNNFKDFDIKPVITNFVGEKIFQNIVFFDRENGYKPIYNNCFFCSIKEINKQTYCKTKEN